MIHGKLGLDYTLNAYLIRSGHLGLTRAGESRVRGNDLGVPVNASSMFQTDVTFFKGELLSKKN